MGTRNCKFHDFLPQGEVILQVKSVNTCMMYFLKKSSSISTQGHGSGKLSA